MGQDVWYVLDKLVLERSEASALSTSSPRHAHHLQMQTIPVRSVMQGHYEGITKVDFTLTEASQMIGGQEGWRTVACTSAQATSRRGKLRYLLGVNALAIIQTAFAYHAPQGRVLEAVLVAAQLE